MDKISEDLEKAKRAKLRAEKKIADLKRKQEEAIINNKLTLLNQILDDQSIVDFLRNRNIDGSLLNEALENRK